VFSAVIDGQGGTLSELQLRKYDEQTNNGGLIETFHRLIGNPPAPERHQGRHADGRRLGRDALCRADRPAQHGRQR
jgi:hypothetical protein